MKKINIDKMSFDKWCTINKEEEIEQEWDYVLNKIDPCDVNALSNKKVWWRCGYGHSYKCRVKNRTVASPYADCPYCSGHYVEKYVRAILDFYRIPFEEDRYFSGDSPHYTNSFRADLFCSNQKVIIEIDSIYHFPYKKHEFATFANYMFDKFKSTRQEDNQINEYCLKHHIPILRIPYTYDIGKDDVKIAKIVKSYLETKLVPPEIIEYYERHDYFGNYAEIATELNKYIEEKRANKCLMKDSIETNPN